MEYITIVLLCFVVILQLAMMFLIVSSERENRDKMEKMIMSNSRSIEKLQEGNEKISVTCDKSWSQRHKGSMCRQARRG